VVYLFLMQHLLAQLLVVLLQVAVAVVEVTFQKKEHLVLRVAALRKMI
jgi:hypothetical protein